MTPTLTEFNPFAIKWQGEATLDVRKKYNYDLGVHELLLSGSVGSAKSLWAAHMIVTHCLFNKGARGLLARRSMPDLKDTILSTVLEHIECLQEGKDYTFDKTRAKISFSNGSEIISRSWADGKIKKFRSLLLSMAVIEELTENDDLEFYKEIKMRVGRLPHIKEQLIISATNPDSPSHPAYKYFILNQTATRRTYYSVTSDNPFLPPTYIENLKETLTPREAERMLYGKWLDTVKEVVYYNYKEGRNFKDEVYQYNRRLPVDIMFDFNIALGKPMSAAVGQVIGDTFHAAKTFIVDGARTDDILEEMYADGIFEISPQTRVFGDAAGKHNDTRSIRSDYDIISNFLRRHGINYRLMIKKSNPPIRKRHNEMNTLFQNANGKVNFYVYKDAKELSDGLLLTKLKKGSKYIEDDSFRLQHVTTAAGYWVNTVLSGLGGSSVQTYSR